MTKVSFFKSNPAFLTRQELTEGFVVRQVDLELVLERIRENTGPSSQHMLLIGTRGMGKTTLVLRVETAIKEDPALEREWYPIRFSEESYEVSSAAEFWLEALGHLATQTGQERWKVAYRSLRQEGDDQRLFDQALARLLDYADESGKRLLLIVENLNMLLGDQISDDDAWSLRHTLLNERRIALLATATSRFSEIDESEKPFYELFWVYELEPLNTDECRALWKAVSGVEEEGNRIRPIQILTGGNPRLLAILASFASEGSLRTLISDLEYWVDEHTSYFKANLEQLPTKERKVYVTLANLWHPATSREVADMARMKINEVSALLNRLKQRGAVTEQKSGRVGRYQVAERMYNIYYLMRQHSGRGDRVRAVVEFMILYYDHDNIARTMAAIGEEACRLAPDERTDHFFVYAGVLQRHPDELRREAVRATRPEFFALEGVPPVIYALREEVERSSAESKADEVDLDALVTLLEQNPNDLDPLWRLADILIKEPERARGVSDTLRSRLRHVQPVQWYEWGALSMALSCLGDYEGAAHTLQESLRSYPEQGELWAYLAELLDVHLGDAEEALQACRRALALDLCGLASLNLLVNIVSKPGREDLKKELESRVLAYHPVDFREWKLRGNIFYRLKSMQEAARSYRAALEHEPGQGELWYHLGMALRDELAQQVDAEHAFRKAVELTPDNFWYWWTLGLFLAQYLKNFEEAEVALRKAIELDPDSAWAWQSLGVVLYAQDSRMDEAIACLRKSCDLDPTSRSAWSRLGSALATTEPREALDAYCKAIERDALARDSWDGVRALFLMSGSDALELDVHRLVEEHEPSAWAWGILGMFLQHVRHAARGALAAYRKALAMEPVIPSILESAVEVAGMLLDTDREIKEEAARDIRRAATRVEENPEALNAAAWKVYESAWSQLYAYAEQWARAAVALRPGDLQMQQTLACILLERGQVADALALGGELLSALGRERKHVPVVSDFFIRAAAAGHAQEALAVLRESEHRGLLEPLLVALQMAAGEECHPPQEVSEIARDILQQIASIKAARSRPAP
jgi:tetratricopeptide (TPR) repeat protein